MAAGVAPLRPALQPHPNNTQMISPSCMRRLERSFAPQAFMA
jgi:hypothetical protein